MLTDEAIRKEIAATNKGGDVVVRSDGKLFIPLSVAVETIARLTAGQDAPTDPDVAMYQRSVVRAIRQHALEQAAALHESINPASDAERLNGDPGAGAMGAIIEYRDKIRAMVKSGAA